MKSKVVNVIDKDDAVMMMMLLRGTPEKYVLQKAQKASRDHSAYFDYMQILVPRFSTLLRGTLISFARRNFFYFHRATFSGCSYRVNLANCLPPHPPNDRLLVGAGRE